MNLFRRHPNLGSNPGFPGHGTFLKITSQRAKFASCAGPLTVGNSPQHTVPLRMCL